MDKTRNRTTTKNGQEFVIPNGLTEKSDHFYGERYPKWEQSSFWVYDYFANKEKTFIDIGGWNGCTAVYASRLYKHVFSYEPDPVSLKDFHLFLEANPSKNLTLFESPVYSSNTTVNFAPQEAGWNTSSSHIKDKEVIKGKDMKTLTFEDINNQIEELVDGQLDAKNVGLIKIDIESGEQFLKDSILKLDPDIPLYISFHVDWWKKRNEISRWDVVFKKYGFVYATTSFGFEDGDSLFLPLQQADVIEYIKENPFTSLVLSQEKIRNIPTPSIFKRMFSKFSKKSN